MELTTPNSAATEHADVDNTEPRESDATERATRATHPGAQLEGALFPISPYHPLF